MCDLQDDCNHFGYFSTLKLFVSQPLLADPQDKRNAFCKPGKFGDSLFARRDFKVGDIIVYYGGMISRKYGINMNNKTYEEK